MSELTLVASSIGFGCASYANFAFDALVKREHSEHLEAWLGDGRPGGTSLLDRIPGSAPGRSIVPFLATRWAFVTPPWARADVRARALLLAYRLALAAAGASLLIAVPQGLR